MKYLFKAKTREGFVLKLISEMLSNFIKYPPFHIDHNGIYLRAMDQACETLVDLDLPRENFPGFKCLNPLNFIVNSSHFYRLLKTIKKKDSVTMFISEQFPMKLGICVEPNDEYSERVVTYINITYIQPEDIDLPDGYGDPIIVTSKNFQKLKILHSIGSELKVTIFNQNIKFFVNGKNLFSREISIGQDDDDEDVVNNSKSFCQTFVTSSITQLTKCAGQSGNVQILADEELPLQIKMRTGSLGNLTVYIKSKELVEMLEHDDGIQNVTNEIGGIIDLKNNYSKEESEDEEDDEDEQYDVEEDKYPMKKTNVSVTKKR